MGNLNSYWVNSSKKLDLKYNPEKITYHVLTIQGILDENAFLEENNNIMILNSDNSSSYILNNSYDIHNFYDLYQNKKIVPTLGTIRNYFPRTYQEIKRIYCDKLGYFQRIMKTMEYGYENIINSFTNKANIKSLENMIFIYRTDLDIQEILNIEFMKYQNNFKNKLFQIKLQKEKIGKTVIIDEIPKENEMIEDFIEVQETDKLIIRNNI